MARQVNFFGVYERLPALPAAGDPLELVGLEPFRSNSDAALIGPDQG